MKFSGINLLDELAREELADLRAVFNKRSYSKDSIIFSPQSEENTVFVIAEGRVRIYLAYEDKEFTLGILKPGDIYSTHAKGFVQALETTSLLTTDVQSVKRLMAEVPLFNRTIVRVLGHILQNAFTIIESLAFKDIYNRLIDYILSEAANCPEHTGKAVTFKLDLTIEQLAQLVGASRQTVSTLLNDIERAGLILKKGRGHYLIPDLPALQKSIF